MFNVSAVDVVALLVSLAVLLLVVYLVVFVARIAWKGREPKSRL